MNQVKKNITLREGGNCEVFETNKNYSAFENVWSKLSWLYQENENKSSMDESGSPRYFGGDGARVSHNCFKPETKLGVRFYSQSQEN